MRDHIATCQILLPMLQRLCGNVKNWNEMIIIGVCILLVHTHKCIYKMVPFTAFFFFFLQSQGNIAKWKKKEGDKVSSTKSWCYVSIKVIRFDVIQNIFIENEIVLLKEQMPFCWFFSKSCSFDYCFVNRLTWVMWFVK